MDIAAHVDAQTDRLHRRLTERDAAIEAELDRMLDAAMSSPDALFALGGELHDAPMRINGKLTTVERALIDLYWLALNPLTPPKEPYRLALYIRDALCVHFRDAWRDEAESRVRERGDE